MSNQKPLVGQTIGPYKVTSFITSGGMADVYKAHDVSLERDAALKVLFPQFSHDEVFVERFQREAKAAAKLHHPNIVQVYATGKTPNHEFYIAMQYIAAGSLDERLVALGKQKRVLEKGFALSLMLQIAHALSATHQAGIVHRDLKPSNILLKPDNTPVLTDLGIAAVRNASKLTQTDTMLGTPDYMSPEQARNGEIDGRSDIYSFGVMLFELLVGHRPFGGDGPWAIIHHHLNTPPPRIGKIRADLKTETIRIVHTCLQKNPDKRYQTAGELAVALQQALAVEDKGSHYVPADGLASTVSPSIFARLGQRQTGATHRPQNYLWVYVLGVVLFLFSVGGALYFGGFLSSEQVDVGALPVAVTSIEAEMTADIAPVAAESTAEAPLPTLAPTSTIANVDDSSITAEESGSGDVAADDVASLSTPSIPLSLVGSSLGCDAENRFAINDTIPFQWDAPSLSGLDSQNQQLVLVIAAQGGQEVYTRAAQNSNSIDSVVWAFPRNIASMGLTAGNYTWRVNLVASDGTPISTTDTGCFAIVEVAETSATAEFDSVEAIVTPANSASAGVGDGLPITFEDASASWGIGDEKNGTFARSTAEVYRGSAAGKLSYDFGTTGNDYVVFLQNNDIGHTPDEISVWVYGDGSNHFLNVWITDANGTVWQVPLGQVLHSGRWAEMKGVIDSDQEWPWARIRGPQSNGVAYPIRFTAVVLDDFKNNDTGSGEIYLDDLTARNSDAVISTSDTDVVTVASAATAETTNDPPSISATSTPPPTVTGDIGRILYTTNQSILTTDPTWSAGQEVGTAAGDTCSSTPTLIDGTSFNIWRGHTCGIPEATEICTSPNGVHEAILNHAGDQVYTISIRAAGDQESTGTFIIQSMEIDRAEGFQWSPQSNQFVFVIGDTLYRGFPTGGFEELISPIYSPIISADGTQVLYRRPVGPGVNDVFVANLDGSGQTNLTNNTGLDKKCAVWIR